MTEPQFWLAVDGRTDLSAVLHSEADAIELKVPFDPTVVYLITPDECRCRDVTEDLAVLYRHRHGMDGLPEAYRQFFEDDYARWRERTT